MFRLTECWIALALLLLGNGAASKPTGRTSLAFVVDTSQAMRTDVRRFVQWAAVVLPAKKAALEKRFDHFLVAPFGATRAASPTSSEKASVLIETLKSLRVDGNGSCEKMILHAILKTANEVKPGGIILVLTNGLPHDDNIEGEVIKLLKKRGVHLIFAQSGCCGKVVCKGQKYEVLKRLAKASKGVVYRIGLADTQQIVKMITEGNYRTMGFPKEYVHVLKQNAERSQKKVALTKVDRDKQFKAMTSRCHEKILTTAKEIFVHGCSVYQCTKNGFKIVDQRCDANQDGWDCRNVSDSWKCTSKGQVHLCKCIHDKQGVLIKIV